VDGRGDVSTEPVSSDADLLAGLHVRRKRLPAVMAVLWGVSAVVNLVWGSSVQGVVWSVLAVAWVGIWWADPRPRVRAVTPEALVVQQGVRTRRVARSDVREVEALYGGSYGLTLVLDGDEPLRLDGTALRFSVADAQAGALRRWAGLAG
jgi:hypothetical protein